MYDKSNKFLAKLTNDYTMYERLSREYNIKASEIIQIDLNRSGVFLEGRRS